MLIRVANESNQHIDDAIERVASYCGQEQLRKWHKLKHEKAYNQGFDFTLIDDFFESCHSAIAELGQN